MRIKGEYKDILWKNSKMIKEWEWRANTIAPEYGNFLAAVMKKEYKVSDTPFGVGIEYIAVGSSTNKDPAVFRGRVESFFNNLNLHPGDESKPFPVPVNNWIWAKKIIDVADIIYLKPDDSPAEPNVITNKLQIQVKFEKTEPDTTDTLEFVEFALVGIYKPESEPFDTNRMFLINHVNHGVITKDNETELTRTIKLSFPITCT